MDLACLLLGHASLLNNFPVIGRTAPGESQVITALPFVGLRSILLAL